MKAAPFKLQLLGTAHNQRKKASTLRQLRAALSTSWASIVRNNVSELVWAVVTMRLAKVSHSLSLHACINFWNDYFFSSASSQLFLWFPILVTCTCIICTMPMRGRSYWCFFMSIEMKRMNCWKHFFPSIEINVVLLFSFPPTPRPPNLFNRLFGKRVILYVPQRLAWTKTYK